MRRSTLSAGVVRLLSSTLTLSFKTRLSAWRARQSVAAETAVALHEAHIILEGMCEQLVEELVDAEGTFPQAFSTVLKLSSIAETTAPEFDAVVAQLIGDHEQLIADSLFLAVILDNQRNGSMPAGLFERVEKHERCIERMRSLVSVSVDRTTH